MIINPNDNIFINKREFMGHGVQLGNLVNYLRIRYSEPDKYYFSLTHSMDLQQGFVFDQFDKTSSVWRLAHSGISLIVKTSLVPKAIEIHYRTDIHSWRDSVASAVMKNWFPRGVREETVRSVPFKAVKRTSISLISGFFLVLFLKISSFYLVITKRKQTD